MLGAIVGRERELEELAALVDDVEQRPRAVVLVGEAGVGKTTLLETAVERAVGKGWTVLDTRPAETEARLSFAGLGDLLRGRADRGLDLLPPPQRRALSVALMLEDASGTPPETYAIAAGLRSLLLGLVRERPLLLAIDDVQWLDGSSADALAFVLRRLEGEPIVLVCAERREREGLLPLGLARARIPVDIVSVGPLSIGALHRMLRTRLGTSFSHPTLRRIEAASRGNPFLALEIARALQRRGIMSVGVEPLPVPETVAGLVQERLSELDAETLDVLRVVALGSGLSIARVLTVCGDSAAVDRAVSVGFLESEKGMLRFTHPLFAAVIDEATPSTRSRELHARLARASADLEEHARHLALAATSTSLETAEVVERAARNAVARGAPVSAGELFRLAAELTPEGSEERVRRELEGSDYLAISGETAAARTLLERLVEDVEPGRLRAGAQLRLARIREDDFEAAELLLAEALATDGLEASLAADLHFAASDVAWARGDRRRGQEHAHRALEHAEADGDPAMVASALVQVVWLDWSSGLPLDDERLERALALERDVDPLALRASPSQVAGHALLALGRQEEARAAFESALTQAESAGVQYWRVDVLYRLCLLEGRSGNLARADELADACLSAAEQLGLEQLESAALYGRGLTYLLLGRLEDARAAAALGVAASRRVGEKRYALWNEWLLGFVDHAAGLHSEAAARLGAVFEAAVHQDDLTSLRGMLPLIIDAHISVGDFDTAAAALCVLDADLRDPVSSAQAQRCRGALAAARGDLEAALDPLEASLRILDAVTLPLERVRTLLVLGGVQRRLKRRRSAREALAEALRICEQIGTPLWADQARAELARVSGRAPGDGRLTENELRIAGLVAEGMTNKEVAAALFLSVRAVESTLSKVYTKLEVRSRTELAAKLRQPA